MDKCGSNSFLVFFPIMPKGNTASSKDVESKALGTQANGFLFKLQVLAASLLKKKKHLPLKGFLLQTET